MKSWGILIAALLFWAGQAEGRANYTGYSGSPGRQVCASSCHGSSNGTVVVSGFPELYTPGTPYTITLTRSGGSNIRNFNASCRLGGGTSNAGVLSGGQGTTTYNTNGESNGVHCGSGNLASCSFTWTAPAAGAGEARLYVAAYQGSGTNGQTTYRTLVAAEGSGGDPELVVQAVEVLSDDDGDHLAENGETIELGLVVENTGAGRIDNISGVITSDSPWIQFTQVESEWEDLSAGESARNATSFVLVVDPNLAGDVDAPLELALSTDDGEFVLEASLPLHWQAPPPLSLMVVDWQVSGDSDGDGVWESGEACQLYLTLLNLGMETATGVEATLQPLSEWIQVTAAESGYPDLPSMGSGVNQSSFSVALSGDAPPLIDAPFLLEVTSMGSAGTAAVAIPAGVRQLAWQDDLEAGAPGWSHSALNGWNDDWGLEVAGQGSPIHAWWCGDPDLNYLDHQDARLVSPPVELPPFARLEFQHRLVAEASSTYPDSAYDGGVLEISLDDGASWQPLEPRDGYSHWFRFLTGSGAPTSHPFPAGTPCFSGTRDWESVVCDLTAYGEVPVRFGFRFGSDNGTSRAGWILDDFRVVGLAEDTVVEPTPLPTALELLPASPNPFNPSTVLAWRMPEAGAASLRLYNLRGELVEILAAGEFPAGERRLTLEAAGLASGTYLLRLEAFGEVRTRRLLLLK